MARFTEQLIASEFVQGMTLFRTHYYGSEQFNQIVIRVTVAGKVEIRAIVDSGATWCILDPVTFVANNLEEQAEYLFDIVGWQIRGHRYTGRLFKLDVRLEAEAGTSLDVQATVFVPTLQPGERWHVPNFIGLDGFLLNIRFAVDPAENAFYFALA